MYKSGQKNDQKSIWEVPGSLYESISTEMAVYYFQQSEKRMAEVISMMNKIHERSYTLLGIILVIIPIVVALSFKTDLLMIKLASIVLVLFYGLLSIGLFSVMRPKVSKTLTSDPRYVINDQVYEYIKTKYKVASVGLKEITLYEVEANQDNIAIMHSQNEKLAKKYGLLLRSVFVTVIIQLIIAAVAFAL